MPHALSSRIVAERFKHDRLLCSLFGSPFRPAVFAPAWRTPDATALAHGICAGRAFGRPPILADALLEAGCDSNDLLTHCRTNAAHARGCWAVDVVLGKLQGATDRHRVLRP